MATNFLLQLSSITTSNLDAVLEMIPASVYCKDKHGRYLACNNAFLQDSNLEDHSNVIGHTDFDFPWKNNALSIYENDQAIIHADKPTTFIEQVDLSLNDPRTYLSYKSVLRSYENKIIGIIGFSFSLKQKPINDYFANIESSTDLPLLKSLTKRQVECLSYLAQGMTIKQIGKILKLSPRTIETHFDAIKTKLKCSSRYELIKIALKLGIK